MTEVYVVVSLWAGCLEQMAAYFHRDDATTARRKMLEDSNLPLDEFPGEPSDHCTGWCVSDGDKHDVHLHRLTVQGHARGS